MKIKIIRNCAIGGQHREAGTIIEVDKQTAITLVTLNRAILAEEAGPEQIQQRDPKVETRDPEVATTKRKARANG